MSAEQVLSRWLSDGVPQLSHGTPEPRHHHGRTPEADPAVVGPEARRYDLYVSEFVTSEAAAGDAEAARLRLRALDGIPEIALTETAAELAEALIEGGPLPEKAALDALHIAAALSGGVEYLLT